MTTKFIVSRDGREYIMDSVPEWAADSPDYKVEKLSSVTTKESIEEAIEEVKLLQEIYTLDEQEIARLKERLEEAVELVESIHAFASNQTNNIMESRGLLLLIAEACDKWLVPREK
jgi:hypothetical protein